MTASLVSPLKRSTRRTNSSDSRSNTNEMRTTNVSTTAILPSRSNSKGKQRAVFCDVIVEDVQCCNGEYILPPHIANILPGLGKELDIPTTSPAFPTTPSKVDSLNLLSNPLDRPPDAEKLRNLLQELLKTEENYVRRLRTLHDLYAQPLRQFAQKRDEEIIPSFEAKQIFGNVESLLPANQEFLHDLWASLEGQGRRERWPSVVLRHFTHFATIYPKYLSNLDNAKAIERDVRSKNRSFSRFIDRTREVAADGHQNSSLESLLIEPAQRIPRYLLILKSALKELSFDDPVRPTVVAAMDIASQIASLDEDEQTRRAAALFAVSQVVEGMPARFTSSGRYFVDCIDVLDTPLPTTSIGSAPGHGTQYAVHTADLFCTLFLFNDQIIIAKRETNDRTGRALVGLDDINKLATDMRMQRSTSNSRSPWKGRAKTMKFRGAIDLGELTARDLGALDFSLCFDRTPSDHTSEKWNGRALRNYRLVKPETPSDKARFLRNIWQSMAQLKGQGNGYRRALCLRTQDLSAYWNLYDRKTYALEARKARTALQLSCLGDVHPLQVSNSAPKIVICARMVDATSCSYSTYTRQPEGVQSQHAISDFPALTRHVLETAIHLSLMNNMTRAVSHRSSRTLDRQGSSMSSVNRSPSKRMSQSVTQTVLDVMMSPSKRDPESPQRTLSRGSKASTVDSRMAVSIFSGDYPESSSAATSILSHSPPDVDGHRRHKSVDRTSCFDHHLIGTVAQQPAAAELDRGDSRASRKIRTSLYIAGNVTASSSSKLGYLPEGDSSKSLYDSEIDRSTLSDNRPLSRSVSSIALRPKIMPLARSSSAQLARSQSVQSLRIDEDNDDEEEILFGDRQASATPAPRTPPHNVMTPIHDAMLSPAGLHRRSTLTRPQGPRALGSRSPAASPCGLSKSMSAISRPASRAADENDPFIASRSGNRKRSYDENLDHSSSSSKRPAPVTKNRALTDPTTPISRTASQPRKGHADPFDAVSTAARQANSVTTARTGSLPRSPHTRSLFQQSRELPVAPSSDTQQSLHSVSRIHRKPVPNRFVETVDERLDTAPAKQYELLEAENEKLKTELAGSREEVESLTARINELEDQLRTRGSALSSSTRSGDIKLDVDVELSAVKSENKRLQNEKRALQVLLKQKTPTRHV